MGKHTFVVYLTHVFLLKKMKTKLIEEIYQEPYTYCLL